MPASAHPEYPEPNGIEKLDVQLDLAITQALTRNKELVTEAILQPLAEEKLREFKDLYGEEEGLSIFQEFMTDVRTEMAIPGWEQRSQDYKEM